MSETEIPMEVWLERQRDHLRTLAHLHMGGQLRRRVDASDIVQMTLFRAHQAKGQFRGKSDSERAAWLRRIMANTLAEEIRKHRRRKRDVALERSLDVSLEESSASIDAFLTGNTLTPSDQAIYEEEISHLRAALNALPEDQRLAVTLHHVMRYSVDDVATDMDRTAASVAGLLRRGMEKLRELLGESG